MRVPAVNRALWIGVLQITVLQIAVQEIDQQRSIGDMAVPVGKRLHVWRLALSLSSLLVRSNAVSFLQNRFENLSEITQARARGTHQDKGSGVKGGPRSEGPLAHTVLALRPNSGAEMKDTA